MTGPQPVSVPGWVVGIVAAGWIAWFLPFLLARRNREAPPTLDRRARVGIVLQGVAYFLVWQVRLWMMPPSPWRVGLGVVFFVLAALLSWSSARILGRQWRLDAGLNADHELVQGGAYRVLRHPIYASMLCLLFGMGFLLTPLPLLLLATLFHLAGTEIRVRIEDTLLESRFGDEFRSFKSRVPAYVPFVR